jgi:hypothetical protein
MGATWTNDATHAIAMPFHIKEFGWRQRHLPTGNGLPHAIMQYRRQAVAMDIPPRPQMSQELATRMLGPTLPDALIIGPAGLRERQDFEGPRA